MNIEKDGRPGKGGWAGKRSPPCKKMGLKALLNNAEGGGVLCLGGRGEEKAIPAKKKNADPSSRKEINRKGFQGKNGLGGTGKGKTSPQKKVPWEERSIGLKKGLAEGKEICRKKNDGKTTYKSLHSKKARAGTMGLNGKKDLKEGGETQPYQEQGKGTPGRHLNRGKPKKLGGGSGGSLSLCGSLGRNAPDPGPQRPKQRG